jgi:acyl-CoA synthetase (AMP-forming)/AMP-acid ligase II
LQAFADKFAAAGFSRGALYPCYGLAEATLIVSGGRRGDGVRSRVFGSRELRLNQAVPAQTGQRLVSCGVARAEHRLVIADPETGNALPSGRVGEIQVAGPSIARGYWNNAEATRRTFVERAGGVFLRTGDLGFLHEGELFVTGREKDMIILRGQNLYPQDIERAVEADNAVVRSGRVVAFALEVAGEEGIAIAAEVSPRLQKLIEPPSVCREIAERVAQHFGEPPKLVLLLKPGAVPLTSSGKLQRSACKRGWLDRVFEVIAAHGPGAEDAAE